MVVGTGVWTQVGNSSFRAPAPTQPHSELGETDSQFWMAATNPIWLWFIVGVDRDRSPRGRNQELVRRRRLGRISKN